MAAELYSDITSVEVQTLLNGTYFQQKDPSETGALDNMVSANYVDFGYNIAYRMAGFFVAAMSGNHIFVASCDDMCTVYFNHSPEISRTNYKIIEVKNATYRLKFDQ